MKMQDICQNCGIDSWKMGTCMDSSIGTIDENYSQNQQYTMLHRMLQQQSQILEDMEDAIESAFIEMISMHLDRSRELHKLS